MATTKKTDEQPQYEEGTPVPVPSVNPFSGGRVDEGASGNKPFHLRGTTDEPLAENPATPEKPKE